MNEPREDIAQRALEKCGEGMFTAEAVTDLVFQILTIRAEPWQVPPGTRPRLRAWGEGVTRLATKPSVMEILEAGRLAGEPIAVTFTRVRGAYPRLTEAALEAEVDAYLAWLHECADQQRACVRELERESGRRKSELESSGTPRGMTGGVTKTYGPGRGWVSRACL